MTPLTQAFTQVILDPYIWCIVILAALYGVFIGATPGLTATMATALLVPLTYWLGPVPALAAVVTMVACAIFAGDIPTTLVRIPGTPASAAYADDAHYFTLKRQPEKPLGVCLVCSVAGGLFGGVVLMLLGHQLAELATFFSVAEYFWLYLLGLSCAVLVSQGSLLRALIGLLLGLLLSTVGFSAVHTEPRFTFGNAELYEGISFIPAMIGLFGVSEVLKNVLYLSPRETVQEDTTTTEASSWEHWITHPVRTVFQPGWSILSRRLLPALRSGSIGAVIGMLPGAGADIAAWVSLAVSKRAGEGKTKKEKGKTEEENGDSEQMDVALRKEESEISSEEKRLEGIADATAANSAALAGAWIPALVFGIPGDSVTAIVLGVLLMKNIKPGPEIFQKQTALVYSIYLIFILANLILIPVGFVAIHGGSYLVRVPRRILLPVILLFCIVGAYAIRASYFDVGIMLVMGILGFLLERWLIPLAPVVLGIILGGPLEERFLQTITGEKGSLLGFVNRPLAAGLGIFCILLWGFLIFRIVRNQARQ